MTSSIPVSNRSLRRSKLVVKGGTWDAIAAAHASNADIVHLELEGGFPPAARENAVRVTRRALEELDWSNKEAWVRFRHIENDETPAEIAYVIEGRPQLVYCAKVKSADDIKKLDDVVTHCERQSDISQGSTQIGAVIEQVEALNDINAIASGSARMSAIMFGANDMSLNFGYRRTGVAGVDYETLYIRSKMVLAGRLARIDVLDAAFMNRNDIAGADSDADFSARLGFSGKTALSVDQIAGIHRAFIPTDKELAWAHEVVSVASIEDPSMRFIDGDAIEESTVARARILLARAL